MTSFSSLRAPFALMTGLLSLGLSFAANAQTQTYGLIGSISAQPGRRDDLVKLLPHGCAGLPGCLSYMISRDLTDIDVIWITEVWRDKASHEAVLNVPKVRATMATARPLIAKAGKQIEIEPVDVTNHAVGN